MRHPFEDSWGFQPFPLPLLVTKLEWGKSDTGSTFALKPRRHLERSTKSFLSPLFFPPFVNFTGNRTASKMGKPICHFKFAEEEKQIRGANIQRERIVARRKGVKVGQNCRKVSSYHSCSSVKQPERRQKRPKKEFYSILLTDLGISAFSSLFIWPRPNGTKVNNF